MNKKDRISGQTLIETALILVLLLIILLGIAEFARAWFTKSSLKSAVRSGARVAVVTPSITEFTNKSCPDANVVINKVCTSPGVRNTAETTVSVELFDSDGNAKSPPAVSGDEVKVSAQTTFTFIIGNSPWPWPKQIQIRADSSMRYE